VDSTRMEDSKGKEDLAESRGVGGKEGNLGAPPDGPARKKDLMWQSKKEAATLLLLLLRVNWRETGARIGGREEGRPLSATQALPSAEAGLQGMVKSLLAALMVKALEAGEQVMESCS
jgi:hypothetical protein